MLCPTLPPCCPTAGHINTNTLNPMNSPSASFTTLQTNLGACHVSGASSVFQEKWELNNVRSRERIVQVKLFGFLFSPYFIILSCHGEKLYITISLSLYTCCLCLNALFSLSFPLFPLRGQKGTTS